MDRRRFDTLARNLAAAVDRRTTIRAAIAGALAATATRAGNDAEGAPAAEACRKVGSRCDRKKHTCCNGGRCARKQCRCARNQKQCGTTCIPKADCCTDADCGNGTCVRGQCIAETVPCSPDDCEGCCERGVCKRGTSADSCGAGGAACISCGTNETCNGSGCVCQAPFTTCGTACVDIRSDEGHCGACGTRCAGNETCRNGACFVLVTPGNLNGWVNNKDNNNFKDIQFVAGPGNPPLGSGSAKFELPNDGSARVSIVYPPLADTTISDITELSYATYQQTGGPNTPTAVPGLKLPTVGIDGIDRNGNDTSFATIIYEPVYSGGAGTVVSGEWQNWNALAPEARWWASNHIKDPATPGQLLMCSPIRDVPVGAACPSEKQYVPWSVVLQAAGAGKLNPAGVQLELGSGSPQAISYVDALVVNGTTFDFEPDAQGSAGKSGKSSRKASGRSGKAQRRGKNRR